MSISLAVDIITTETFGMIDLNAQIQQQMRGTANRVGIVHSQIGASMTIEDDGSIEARTASGMGLRIDATTGVISLVGSDIQSWCTSLEIQGSQGSTVVLNDDHIQLTEQYGSSSEINSDHVKLTDRHGASLILDAAHLMGLMNGARVEIGADGQTLTVCNRDGMGLFVTKSTTSVVGPHDCKMVLSYDSVNEKRIIAMDCDQFMAPGV